MDDTGGLKRKDTTKGPPLRVLSLDGGGVRGYSMLIILQEVMHRTFVEMEGRAPKRHEIPKPCDHFDLIAGTGTGGLIALMLGRLRLDLDTCKDLYVRMTRRVFETDKTFAGIPYKSTMFKASKLEEAVREAVREHTIFADEGNDALANAVPMTPTSPGANSTPSRSLSQQSRYSQVGMSPVQPRASMGSLRFGDANALLYDRRENRTKTALTAVMKGTKQTQFLRSYDSRREPAPDVNCTIWEAGRATSANLMAFKPIQIGQSVYLDEGAGKYNPAPAVLDEAAQNEWPGREVGVFISIGTGKRPPGTNNNQSEWWEGFMGGTMGSFAEARRRLIAKLEGCEDTHQYMLQEHLSARGVNVENYYRLNVEVGVGEFGLNEWAQLAKISTSTRAYLARKDIEAMNQNAAAKMAKIHSARVRHERAQSASSFSSAHQSWQNTWERPVSAVSHPSNNPLAVELPGDENYMEAQGYQSQSQQLYDHHRQGVTDAKYVVVSDDGYDHPPPFAPPKISSSQPDASLHPAYRYHEEQNGQHPRVSHESFHSTHSSRPPAQPMAPPPIPPKTPLPYPDNLSPTNTHNPEFGPRTFMHMGNLARPLPYPDQKFEDVDGPPPRVNMESKPTIPR